ncbi:MAPEG family protein [Neomegalonema sp.]|uniref:MAPEG family protein n=1 Tax=Neomegalonema sp. TaxID=2039713 RepID=UPI00261180C5|nr:MAPEG family protein [Neomegalonema sp.]MDD2868812.1 MAPEG family protein [Neomegalonema sp.]
MTAPALVLLLSAALQVALTFAVYVVLARRRSAAIKAGLKLQDTALDASLWPAPARQAQANLANQYELPVLFFAGVGIAFAIGSANWLLAILALVFALTRVWHASEHLGANIVKRRGLAFGLGFAALGLFWAALVLPALFFA